MTAKRLTRKLLKIIAFILGGLLVLLMAFHFWFVHYSESIVEDLVSSQSNGHLKLNVHRFKFNWFTYQMELRKPVFSSNDTAANTSYQFRVEKINIQLKAIWPLLFEKRILIDSMHLYNPDIRVTRWRSPEKDTMSQDSIMSLPREMGRIYNSIQDALKVLNVDRFQIDNGKFSLINRINPEETPVTITNINFHLDNLQVDSTKPGIEKKILFSDNVALHTYNQNILFPDGRHRLAFSNFRINVLKKFVEFDSCTVMATKGDTADNSFRIFFDKLQMTNIDFNALYHQEVIKADSVYCINPRFRLDVTLPEKNESIKSPPKLNELIQQLTGNMQLAFVVVENGSFDINTLRNDRPSSFTSDHNNFELQGLAIKKDAPKPLTVDKFVMAIRNYENFLRDSSYAIQFDSILINDNRISLSNFTYKELQSGKTINSLRMPQFELQGLSWDDLVFDQQLKAEKVTLYRPVIDYSVAMNKQLHTGDVFSALAGIGNFMQLDNLDVYDGRVNLLFRDSTRLNLENTSMSIRGKQLVTSRGLTNVQSSVDKLRFKNGLLKVGDVTAILSDVNFKGGMNDQLYAGSMQVKNETGLDIAATGVNIGSILFDDKIKHADISGINWTKAAIILPSLPLSASKSSTDLGFTQIQGTNTTIFTTSKGTRISVFLKDFKADEFSTNEKGHSDITGLIAVGNNLVIDRGPDQLLIKNFNITDHKASILEEITYTRKSKNDSVNVQIPKLEFTADINSLVNGKVNAGAIRLVNPLIHLSLGKKDNIHPDTNSSKWPEANINSLLIENPILQLSTTSAKRVSNLNWNGTGNKVGITGFTINNTVQSNIAAANVQVLLNHFVYTNAKGKYFDTRDGELNIELSKVEMKKNEINEWDWKAMIDKIDAKNLLIDSLGKKNGKLNITSASLHDFAITSASLLNMHELVSNNTRFRLKALSGNYYNSKHQFEWHNGAYDKNTKSLSADSFSYRPAEDKEAFIASAPYQTDYIAAKTGAIAIGPFDIERYIKDSVWDMGAITINNGRMTIFRDKRKPIEPGTVRPLPVNMLKKIPAHLLADTLRLNDALVEYEEHNEKTNKPGKVTVSRLNGRITNLRNHNVTKTDSLHTLVTGFIENKIRTWLNVKESYTDSLGGFLMTVQMGPADLTVLNPILKPLVSAELKSGNLDTLSMRVIGREYLSFGEIKMFYHDLKVSILKNGGNKKSFMGGIKNFLANTIIKNKNSEKTATIFFKRLRDRSAVNYLVKITFNGIINTVTGKNNKKSYRQYNEEIKNKHLPPVGSFDPKID